MRIISVKFFFKNFTLLYHYRQESTKVMLPCIIHGLMGCVYTSYQLALIFFPIRGLSLPQKVVDKLNEGYSTFGKLFFYALVIGIGSYHDKQIP